MAITTQPAPPLQGYIPQPLSAINHSHLTEQQDDYEPGPTSFADLPQHIQLLILAHAGACPRTCKAVARLVEELQANPDMAALWLTARGIKPLKGAAVKGWWSVCKAILGV
jgi:hypothetical protein